MIRFLGVSIRPEFLPSCCLRSKLYQATQWLQVGHIFFRLPSLLCCVGIPLKQLISMSSSCRLRTSSNRSCNNTSTELTLESSQQKLTSLMAEWFNNLTTWVFLHKFSKWMQSKPSTKGNLITSKQMEWISNNGCKQVSRTTLTEAYHRVFKTSWMITSNWSWLKTRNPKTKLLDKNVASQDPLPLNKHLKWKKSLPRKREISKSNHRKSFSHSPKIWLYLAELLHFLLSNKQDWMVELGIISIIFNRQIQIVLTNT